MSPTSDRGQRLEREVAELYDRLEDARDRFLREKRELEMDIVEIERELAEVRRSSETMSEVIGESSREQ
jgi:cell division septum initiation protein DivIVA